MLLKSIFRKGFLIIVVFLFFFSCGRKKPPVYPAELTQSIFRESVLFFRNGKAFLYLQLLSSRRLKLIRLEDDKGNFIKNIPYPLKSNFIEIVNVKGKKELKLIPVYINGLWIKSKTLNLPQTVIVPVIKNFKGMSKDYGKFVVVKWKGSVYPENSFFNIYRVDKSPYYPLNFAPQKETFYVDKNVKEGMSYQYYVRPITVTGGYIFEGDLYGPVEVYNKPVPPPPPSFVTIVKNEKGIKVLWSKVNSPDVAGYNVYLICGKNKTKLNSKLIKANSFIFKRRGKAHCIKGVSSVGKNNVESSIRKETRKR